MHESDKKRSSFSQWISFVAAALLLYLLSYGPVGAMANRFSGRADGCEIFFMTIYVPLESTSVQLGLNHLRDSYYLWWCDLFNAPC